MKRLLAPVLFAIVAALATNAWTLDAGEMFADPAKETRARALGRQLRCLVCQNESIFDSNAGLARDLRVVVRERIDAGDSDDQIIGYVVERYGDYVLLKPRVTGQTLVLWLTPVLLALLGALGTAAYLRKRGHRTPAPALSDDERAEAQRLLKGDKA